MRCRRARRASAEHDLGLLAAEEKAALARHLDACADCAASLREERMLRRDLAALARIPAPAVDVTARVRQSLPRLDAHARDEVSTRQLGWAAAAALLGTALVLGTLPALWPQLSGLGLSLARLGGSLLGFADTLAAPFVALFWSAARLVEAAGGALDGLRPLALRAEPLARGALFAAYAAMAGVILVVLTRDLRRPLTAVAREGH